MATIQQVELGVLGPLQVRQFGLPVAIPGAKPRAVLTLLGLHGGAVVAADTLVDLLWGDDPPRTAAKALHTHISALRRALGDGFVLTQGTGWTLSGAEIDAARYTTAATLARAAMASGNASEAVARFSEALTLWRGSPELPDGRRGRAERTRWTEGHAALVEDRADALLATGRAAEIIGELEAAIADAPLRERRWGQLMLALYRAGRQGEALAGYQRVRSLLAEELGVDPGLELRRLEAAIVAQHASLELPVLHHHSLITRAVTFLLTDIEGSTAAWERDADAMASALARHDEIVEQVVTSRGGRLIKTRGEGDATFSVFDRPSAAAAAAVELQEAIRHEPWAVAEPLRIRVALHTGEVEFRDGDYFGRAVNRAARLRSLAAGGQILCSGATAELVIDTLADDVILVDRGTRQLKNLARPERVFELRLEGAVDTRALIVDAPPLERPAVPAVLAAPGPFVGRDGELERLFAAWHTALSAGTGATLIAGEPGVGKTRLAGEWSRRAYEDGAFVLYGRCDEDLGAPYQPFAEAMRALVPCLGTQRLRGLRGAEALLALVPGLVDVLPDLSPQPRADADTERYALFDAVVGLLGLASGSAPVVLVLDDLHWAAKPTLLLLRHLLRFGEHARVQIVGTYRSTDLDRSHPLAAMLADLNRDGSVDRLQLGGLDEADVTAYVTASGYDDEELALALAAVTGGNPFFLIEALRHVNESDGRWDPSTLPQGVREAVSRRLSRLPEDTNRALAAAAVVGSRFAVELVERVVEQDLVDAFDEASNAGIVVEEPGGRYRFNHAIVRQSLLAELASVRRMRLHQRIAAELEAEAFGGHERSGRGSIPALDDELLAELAHHYFECAWAGNAAKAVDYCRRAADHAMTRLAYEGAADLYDKALHALAELDEELPDRDEQHGELLIARCEALLAAGDVTSATGAVAQLLSTAGDSGRLAAWGTCFDGELAVLTDPERLDEVEAAVDAAASRLAELDDSAGEAKAYTVRAACLGRLGRIGDCETALDRALTAARRAREHRRVNAVLANAPLAALWGPNPVPRAGGRCLDVVRLLRITTGSPVVEATSTRCQGVLDAFRGRAGAGRQLIDSARRSLTDLGMRHALLEVEQFAGIIELVADDPSAAELHLRQAYNGFRRMGLEADTAETAALLARACLGLGREAEADELCVDSERLAGHALKASISWRTVRAELLAHHGAHAAARQVATEAVSIAERTDALVDHGDACLTLAVVLKSVGDDVGARAAAERAVDLYELKGASALAEKARGLLNSETPAEAAAELSIAEPDSGIARASRLLDEIGARNELAETERTTELPTLRTALTNRASRVGERFLASFVGRDWDAMRAVLAADYSADDRRRTVNAGMRIGREAEVDNFRVLANSGVTMSFTVVATRGQWLALGLGASSNGDLSRGEYEIPMLVVCELDADGKLISSVLFDSGDFNSAVAELDARYAAGEAAAQAHPWSVITGTFAAFNRREAPGETPDWVDMDHRDVVATQGGEPSASLGDCWELTPDITLFVESVHRLTTLGAVVTRAARSTPHERFKAKWRDVCLSMVTGDLVNRCELFDVDDIKAALAQFDELNRPATRLENAASRMAAQFQQVFTACDWDGMAAIFADDIHLDDRRPVVGVRCVGRDATIAKMSASADTGVKTLILTTAAIRGGHLALHRVTISSRDHRPDAFRTEAYVTTEVRADGQIVAFVMFDLGDVAAAYAELEARYGSGEAAPHAATWAAVTAAYGGFNQRDLVTTAPNIKSIDHRRGAAFASGELVSYLEAAWTDSPDTTIRIESVHRLADRGAIVTHAAAGTSQDGFLAEWRDTAMVIVEDGLVARIELFDESAVDAASARFDELTRPTARLENAATRTWARLTEAINRRAVDETISLARNDGHLIDRRRGLRDAQEGWNPRHVIETLFEFPDVWRLETEHIAARGSRLCLSRQTFRDTGDAGRPIIVELLTVLEVDDDELAYAFVNLDADDIAIAIEELDSRYLAGEAAPHVQTYSAVARAFAMVNRREIPLTATDFVDADHRRVAAIEGGGLKAYLSAAFDDSANILLYVEFVHRITDVGAVVTHVATGTSLQGLDVEWRLIDLLTFDGELIDRCELFDEADLDVALARFDELGRPAPRLENAASCAGERFGRAFVACDWNAVQRLLHAEFVNDDRRRVVNAGIRHGRDAEIDDLRASAEVGFAEMSWSVIATRGRNLALTCARYSLTDEPSEGFHNDVLHIVEINADGSIVSVTIFDPDDVDAAVEELDVRYLSGEGASHRQAWSLIVKIYAAFNRHELSRTTPDWVNIDHRVGVGSAPGDMNAYVSTLWPLVPDIHTRIVAVHALSDLGAVFTHTESGKSQEGFDAEWREVALLTFEEDAINRCELFDETDLDAALARFDELAPVSERGDGIRP